LSDSSISRKWDFQIWLPLIFIGVIIFINPIVLAGQNTSMDFLVQTYSADYSTYDHSLLTPSPETVTDTHSRPTVGAIAGGAIGTLAGGFLGFHIGKGMGNNQDLSEFGGLAIGALLGVTTGIPLGAYIGNGKQGRLDLAMVTSLGIATVGLATTSFLQEEPATIIVVSVPIAQVISSVAILTGQQK
jgi:hypothetical protein